jgi:hypothetical protein
MSAANQAKACRHRCHAASAAAAQQLDAVAVDLQTPGVAALADRVGRLLGSRCSAKRTRERRVDVVGRDRDVTVAGADLVGVDAEVA